MGRARDRPVELLDLLDIHRTLLRFSVNAEIAGVIRTSQTWIGGNDHNPIGAGYVPPPAEFVSPLLADLGAFVNRDDLAPVAVAAISHAQCETIHRLPTATVALAARSSTPSCGGGLTFTDPAHQTEL